MGTSEVDGGLAWADFMQFAWANHREQFEQDAGLRLPETQSLLDAAIDEAVSLNDEVLAAFLVWATREFWGWDDAPWQLRATMADHPLAPREEG